MRDDKYLHESVFSTITDIDFASAVGGSENLFHVARFILARLWGRGRLRCSIPVIQGVVESPSTKRHDRHDLHVYGGFMCNGFYEAL